MSDMHMKNKLAQITEAAKNGKHITERAKSFGFTIFLVFVALGIVVLVGFSVALLFYGHRIGAVIFFLLSAAFSYAMYKLITADELRNL